MTKKFKHIDPPYGFRDFYSKYPHGYSIYEALLDWVQQVNDLTDFVSSLPENLKTYTQEQLLKWLEDGTLEELINSSLFNGKVDKVETYAKDFETLEEAFNHAMLNSGVLNLEPKTYIVPSLTFELTSNLTINGNGATLISEENSTMLTFNGVATKYNLQGITTETVDLSNGGSNLGNSTLSVLTLNSVDGINVGDVIYIKQFEGDLFEMSTVKKIDGSKVILSKVLDYTYTNSAVCEKIQGSITIKDICLDTDNFSLEKNNTMIRLYKTVDSVITGLNALRGNSVIIEDRLNHSLKIINSKFSNLINKIGGSSNNLGYGVVIYGSYYTHVLGCEFRNLRHGVATGGYNFGITVENCLGVDCTNAPFDTHELGRYTSFLNCRSFYTVKGSASSATGFIIRADDVTLLNCESINDDISVYIFSGAKNTTIKNCVFESRLNAIRHDGVAKEKLIIDGVTILKSNISSILLDNSSTQISNSSIRGELTSNNGTFINGLNSDIKMRNVYMDASLITSTTTKFYIYLNNSTLLAYDLELNSGDSNIYITYNTGDNTNAKIYGLKGRYNNTVYGANTNVELKGETQRAVFTQEVSGTGVQQNNLIRTLLNEEILINATPTVEGNGLNFSYPGVFAGQRITVTNNSASLNLYLTGSLLRGNRTVEPSRAVSVIWTGSNWA